MRSVAGVGRAPPAALGRIETAAPSRTVTAVRNFWYPVAHSSQVGKDTLMPFDLFDRSWCLFRNEAGLPAVVLDECAHRACPLSLGKNVGGRVQCPYHGWEFNASGVCEKMPSCAFLKGVAVPAMPAVEQDGLIWAWAGDSVPALQLPRFAPPPGFRLVAEVTLEVEAQWGAMLEGLLDIAQRPELRLQQRAAAAAAASGGPLAELGSEAEECASDDGVECLDPWTPGREVAQALAKALRSGGWDHEVLDASFEPPCAVLTSSTLVGAHPKTPHRCCRAALSDPCPRAPQDQCSDACSSCMLSCRAALAAAASSSASPLTTAAAFLSTTSRRAGIRFGRPSPRCALAGATLVGLNFVSSC